MAPVPRRTGIVAVAVLVADFSGTIVNDDFAVLASCDFSGGFNRTSLRRMMRGVTTVTLATDGPFWASFDHVLVCHCCSSSMFPLRAKS